MTEKKPSGGLAKLKSRFDPETTLDGLVREEPQDDSPANLKTTMDFIRTLGRALLEGGVPSHRIETALEEIARARGFEAQVFSTPTALNLSLSDGKAERTRLSRVNPGETDLERLSALHLLVKRVIGKELSPKDAAARTRAIMNRQARYGFFALFLAQVASAAAGTVLLRGGWFEVGAAAVVAIPVYALLVFGRKYQPISGLIPVLAAASVAASIALMISLGVPLRPNVVLLASLFVLLPGYRITTAATELATGHVVSGTARAVSALSIFLQLGFGAAIGYQLGFPSEAGRVAPAFPEYAIYLGTILTGLAIAVKLQARPRDLVFVVVVCLLGIASTHGTKFIGPEIAAFVGALVVGLSSHLIARLRDQPVLVTLTPSIFLLVPGSVGFLSVNQMLESEVVDAVETGFRMLLVVMAIVAGVLVAGAAVPPKRSL